MNDQNATKIIIGEVRFSYAHLFKPRAIEEGQDPRYSVTLLIPKDNTELIEKIKAAIKAAYNANAGIFNGKKPSKLPLKDGEEKIERDTNGHIISGAEFEGCFYINATSKTKPGLVKPGTTTKFTEITDENDLYSGCYGYASVNFFAFNKGFNNGISAGLNNVLLTRKGDYLGGRASAETDFNGLDVGDITGDMPDDLI